MSRRQKVRLRVSRMMADLALFALHTDDAGNNDNWKRKRRQQAQIRLLLLL